ncbi:MAG: glycosyltransferase [Syntrophobacteraceae bacterium]
MSIIIPTYNQCGFLRKCVDSALSQTFKDLEVIVVDDGSTDDTPRVAGEFGLNNNFKYIRQENTGVGAARNRGIDESTGEYLCFLDSDDFYHPDKVEHQARILYENPEFDFIYCDIVSVDISDQETGEAYSVGKSREEVSGDIFCSLFLGGYFPPHTVMVRKAVLEKFGKFDVSLGGHADYELWLRLAAEGCLACYVDRKLAFYRTYSTSMSKDIEHMNKTHHGALEKIARRYPGAVARAVFCLQQRLEEQHAANLWLSKQIRDKGIVAYSFLDHFQEAKLVAGRSDQIAEWSVEMDGSISRAIFLHPPAEALFTLPYAVAGTLSFAIGIHPDVWDKAPPGGCLFSVTIDDRVTFQAILDTTIFTGDRQWHEYELDVPEGQNGVHIIKFQTRVRGNSEECLWAVWREPYFTRKKSA